jgi:hypothetical protein
MYYIVKSMVYKEWIENRTLVSTIFSKIWISYNVSSLIKVIWKANIVKFLD